MAAAPLDQWSDGGSDSDWDWSDEEENDSPFDAAMRDHHQFIIRAVHLGLIDLASDRFPKSTWKNVPFQAGGTCSVSQRQSISALTKQWLAFQPALLF